MKRIISCILILSLVLIFAACSPVSTNLTDELRNGKNLSGVIEDVKENEPKPVKSEPATGTAETPEEALLEFGAELFKNTYETDKNTLISPISVSIALAMTAGGSGGNTLGQFEALLGRGVPMLEMNNFYKAISERFDESEKNDINVANSVWIRDNKDMITVKKSFLDFCDDYFDADVFLSPFNKSTVRDINKWVKDETDGMIKEVINEIDPMTVMYLINALSFEADWKSKYTDTNEYFRFINKDGESVQTTGLVSTENKYLEDENSTGFVKPYIGDEYSFVLLLPKEDDIDSYVSSLTGDKIQALLENAETTSVDTVMPKFTFEYDKSLKEVLQELLLTDAFDSSVSDLSEIGTSSLGNLYVSDVIHKTFIEVAEKGTKAAAVTVVNVKCESAMEIIDTKKVIANRPFVFMIIENESNAPLFMGTVLNVD